ncbi:25S rRNA (adenine2142-N1)-methyltransferase [Gnomoniopsis smithogilvyi]|uniref:25S rRNA adenine-N(1) methyltransferase n=1 Tax=Gnomoniopsis smithogilvyi TaxID=1191159 RepID=A0A9W9CXU3_9PEZI|nr:25S rRNA (adenine2142-N1)-methyltransferase [Gnomoniopsis smithogilvyi]
MGVNKKKKSKLKLTAGRPPVIQKPKTISRKATQSLISQIHTLEKRKKQAERDGDKAAETKIAAEIKSLGGIEKYQQASLQGQRNDRGGDSSRVLLEWLKPIESELKATITGNPSHRLRMLEVGALSTTNACSRSGFFDIQHIDLNSQGDGILQQDFMERPRPKDDTERFDIISLSLVLNFVPEPVGRGDMLLRTLDFLRLPACLRDGTMTSLKPYFPSLFLVLPAPCVSNSRYLDDKKLNSILVSLGYQMTRRKMTLKLVYYLLTRIADPPPLLGSGMAFTKKELRSGVSRNNFAIVLKAPS